MGGGGHCFPPGNCQKQKETPRSHAGDEAACYRNGTVHHQSRQRGDQTRGKATGHLGFLLQPFLKDCHLFFQLALLVLQGFQLTGCFRRLRRANYNGESTNYSQRLSHALLTNPTLRLWPGLWCHKLQNLFKTYFVCL